MYFFFKKMMKDKYSNPPIRIKVANMRNCGDLKAHHATNKGRKKRKSQRKIIKKINK